MNAIPRFLQCSGYPDEPQTLAGGASRLLIDGHAILAQELPNHELRLSTLLERPQGFHDDLEWLSLALKLAFPRMLQDSCSLAWQPDEDKLLLWTQFHPAEKDDEFLAQWEELLNARDWWQRELERNAPATTQEETTARQPSPLLFFRP